MTSYQTNAQRLEAVQSRDSRADGQFVYAVISTGIVCYPSCPSRAALPENMRYFMDVPSALADGYRYCKRCRTDLPPLAVRNRQLVIDACRLIDNAIDAVRIDSIAANLGISRYHLQKLFKQYVGLSPKAYAQAIRLSRLQEHLQNKPSITQALLDAGYESVGGFYGAVQGRLGMKASTLHRGSVGVQIRYGFAVTTFGRIVVAQTAKGLCAVLFGESEESLIADLSQRFPKAILVHDTDDMQPQIDSVVCKINLPDAAIDIPLDILGTVFQEKVWQALRDIQPGKTASYKDVAQAIGQPTAARAVARACSENPLAVLVPCHRVVKADGGLSGYRWGVERKRELLDKESC